MGQHNFAVSSSGMCLNSLPSTISQCVAFGWGKKAGRIMSNKGAIEKRECFFFRRPTSQEDNATLIALSTCQMSLKNLARDLPQHVLRNLWCENCMQRKSNNNLPGLAEPSERAQARATTKDGFKSTSRDGTNSSTLRFCHAQAVQWKFVHVYEAYKRRLKHATTIKIHTGEMLNSALTMWKCVRRFSAHTHTHS